MPAHSRLRPRGAPRHRRASLALALLAGILWAPALAGQAAPRQPARPAPRRAARPPADSVRAIAAPRTPLPSEDSTAGVTRFSFIAYGDTRGRFDGELLQHEHLLVVTSMLRTIAARAGGPDPIRFVVSSGDAVSDGRSAQQWNASFVDVVERLTTRGDVPVLPSVGNHDVAHTRDLASPARKQGLGHFEAAFRNLLPPEGSPRRLAGYPTYAFGYGNTFFLVIDSNVAGDSTQYDWVRAQLEGLDHRRWRHVAVVLHHPAYSSGPHGGAIVEPQSAFLRARYMPLFRQHGVDLVLAGHEHLFEHWAERWRDSTGQRRRLDQIVSGGGGAPNYGYRGEPDLREYVRGFAAESLAVEHLVRPGFEPWENPHHYVVVHVDGDRLRVEVIGVDEGATWQPYRSRSVDLDVAPASARP